MQRFMGDGCDLAHARVSAIAQVPAPDVRTVLQRRCAMNSLMQVWQVQRMGGATLNTHAFYMHSRMQRTPSLAMCSMSMSQQISVRSFSLAGGMP